jgi:hypothetical protein
VLRSDWQQSVPFGILQWYEALILRKQWQTTGVSCLEIHNTADKAGSDKQRPENGMQPKQ